MSLAALTGLGGGKGQWFAELAGTPVCWPTPEQPLYSVFCTGLWAPFHWEKEVLSNNVKVKTKFENQGNHFGCAHALQTECCVLCGTAVQVGQGRPGPSS